MAKRKRTSRATTKKKTSLSFELTRLKLLYGLSGAFTLCVAGLLIARPAPLAGGSDPAPLAAQAQDPLDLAIGGQRDLEVAAWNRIVVERLDTLTSASFHFAVLPQASGDQIAISSEWSRQVTFSASPGELKVALVSADPAQKPQDERTIRSLVERLAGRLRLDESQIEWR